ncbi:MAG TPA: hypothetical protein VHN20_03105, partial [Beijerinckiaceae bacterium]|nr:hypothetical protein [Beijerinckiaceae bacterium]
GELDDFRAVATLAHTNQVVAIVMTEGISRVSEGAGAMETFLGHGGVSIPVIPGASPNPDRSYQAPAKLRSEWRPTAETLNTLLPAPVPSAERREDIATALRPHIRNCTKISLLVIGPWTSFMRYGSEMLGRVDRIVAQGRPYRDELGGQPRGFNCDYDQDACYAAFDLLVGRRHRADPNLRADWVDILGSP